MTILNDFSSIIHCNKQQTLQILIYILYENTKLTNSIIYESYHLHCKNIHNNCDCDSDCDSEYDTITYDKFKIVFNETLDIDYDRFDRFDTYAKKDIEQYDKEIRFFLRIIFRDNCFPINLL